MTDTGRCLCGAVTFEAKDAERHVHACHCSMCRRWAGGPVFGAVVGSVEFTGSEHIGRYDSSDWAERGFCRLCGTSLFYHLKSPEKYILCLGAFDDQTPFEVAAEIFVDEKPGSYGLAGDHPRLTGPEYIASLSAQSPL